MGRDVYNQPETRRVRRVADAVQYVGAVCLSGVRDQPSQSMVFCFFSPLSKHFDFTESFLMSFSFALAGLLKLFSSMWLVRSSPFVVLYVHRNHKAY